MGLKRFALEPEVFAHMIDRAFWHFTPVLVADRFGGDNDGAIVAVWVVVNMREATDLAIITPSRST